MQETHVGSLGRAYALEKGKATHSSILAGEFHGQRSLVDYSTWGHRESYTPEGLTHTPPPAPTQGSNGLLYSGWSTHYSKTMPQALHLYILTATILGNLATSRQFIRISSHYSVKSVSVSIPNYT